MDVKLTANQQALLSDLKKWIARGLSVEIFPDCLVGFDTTEKKLRILAEKGAIRLVAKEKSSYLSCVSYGPCLSVEII